MRFVRVDGDGADHVQSNMASRRCRLISPAPATTVASRLVAFAFTSASGAAGPPDHPVMDGAHKETMAISSVAEAQRVAAAGQF